jgi:transposase
MKIRWEGVEGIYLYRDPVDGRKGIDGLAAIVQSEMGLPSMHCRLFLFSSKNRSRLKILAWDRTGFCLWLKRLEAEKFPWPKDTESTIELTEQMLYAFLDGFNIWQTRPHKTLDYACFF